MDFKLVGGILMIIGTSIGAGMLALPLATAKLGFLGSVNLWLPKRSNLITMAGKTIGPIGQIIAWITYLLLLYSLLCAYISGGSDLFHNLLLASQLDTPVWVSTLVFTLLFGFIVFLGIRWVDYTNRGLMFIKFGAFLLLVILLMPFIDIEKLATMNIIYITSVTALMVTITSFGYATIVPSLRIYFAGD